MKQAGLFIVFEGADGSGKTTLINLLQNKLNELINKGVINYSAVQITREPGGNNNLLAEKIRHLVLESCDFEIPKITEIYLFAASRSAHVINTIQPALHSNNIVLCDRFIDSSVVYQGYMNNIDPEIIHNINAYAINNTLPKITFFLDIDSSVAQNRIKINQRTTNRFDEQALQYHQQVVQYYRQHFQNKTNVYFLDANETTTALVDQCLAVILKNVEAENDIQRNFR